MPFTRDRGLGDRYGYAHPVERAAGYLIDSLFVSIAQSAVFTLWVLSSLFLIPVLSGSIEVACDPSGSSWTTQDVEDCVTGYTWVGFAWLAVLALGQFGAWWVLIPGRMARRGASPGMAVAGLELTDANLVGARVSGLQAFGRAMLASLVLPVLGVLLVGSVLLVWWMRSDGSVTSSESVVSALVWVWVFFVVVSPAWALVDRRGQTLYDKLSSTLAVAKPGPIEPVSMLALCCAFIPLTAPLAVILGHTGAARVRKVGSGYVRYGTARAALAIGYFWCLLFCAFVALLVFTTLDPSEWRG